ncbi:MAG: response regulator [Parcubacteria group bacterium]
MPKKILIIEDEAALQETMAEYLTDEKFEVLSAMDGQTGLEMTQKNLPDLILLDVILPKMDGFQVLEGIKKDDKTKNIPVIMLTNLENMENIQKAFENGVSAYLIKADFKLEDVVKKIKEILKM